MRYWDGQAWTEQTAAAQPASPGDSAPTGPIDQSGPSQQFPPAEQFYATNAGGGSKNGVKFAIIGGAVLVLLVILGVVVALLSGGTKGTAQETADRFIEAFVSSDCDGMVAVTSDELIEEWGSDERFCSYWDDFEDIDARIEWDESKSEIEDDQAVMFYDIDTKVDGEWVYDIWYRVTVEVEDGKWRVVDLY